MPAICFRPRPSVDSTVVRLTRYQKPPVEARDEKHLFALIRASFNQRRKTLANGLANGVGIPRDQVTAALQEMGLPATVRGEALTLEQFATLSNLLIQTRAV